MNSTLLHKICECSRLIKGFVDQSKREKKREGERKHERKEKEREGEKEKERQNF